MEYRPKSEFQPKSVFWLESDKALISEFLKFHVVNWGIKSYVFKIIIAAFEAGQMVSLV